MKRFVAMAVFCSVPALGVFPAVIMVLAACLLGTGNTQAWELPEWDITKRPAMRFLCCSYHTNEDGGDYNGQNPGIILEAGPDWFRVGAGGYHNSDERNSAVLLVSSTVCFGRFCPGLMGGPATSYNRGEDFTGLDILLIGGPKTDIWFNRKRTIGLGMGYIPGRFADHADAIWASGNWRF